MPKSIKRKVWPKSFIFLLSGMLLVLIIAFLGCNGPSTQQNNLEENKTAVTTVVEYANPNALISAEELKKALDKNENIALLDVRKSEFYTGGHIPGAINIYRPDYTIVKNGFGEMLPEPNAFAQFMSKCGIDNNKKIVLYGGYNAFRVWWTMHVYGVDARILNGGIWSWEKAGYKLTKEVPDVTPAAFNLDESKFRLESVVDAADVAAQIDNEKSVIVDCRSYEEYTGAKIKKGDNRGGHIPGAIWIEWKQNLNKDMALKPAAELEALYKQHGITKNTPVYLYSHSGARSSVGYYALHELLGYEQVYNFDGSWIVWDKKMEYRVAAGD